MSKSIWKAEYFKPKADGTLEIKPLATAANRSAVMGKLERISNGKYSFYDFYDDTNEVVVREDGSENKDGYLLGGEGIHISKIA